MAQLTKAQRQTVNEIIGKLSVWRDAAKQLGDFNIANLDKPFSVDEYRQLLGTDLHDAIEALDELAYPGAQEARDETFGTGTFTR